VDVAKMELTNGWPPLFRQHWIAWRAEIWNWILVARAIGPRALRWSDYYPIYRGPAGTKVGVGVAVWDLT
jgi:hypothetical protein